jgi:hypothetical protein
VPDGATATRLPKCVDTGRQDGGPGTEAHETRSNGHWGPRGFPAFITSSRGIGSIYGWTGGGPSRCDGGTLWAVTESGIVACVNPATGRVRVQEVVPAPQALGIYALAADRHADELVAVVGNTAGFSGVATISPPRGCWG